MQSMIKRGVIAQITGMKTSASVRLMPAAMVTVAAVLGLKAVAFAQGAAEVAAEEHAAPAEHAEGETQTAETQNACPAPTFAETAGLSQSEVQVLQALGARREALQAREGEIDTEAALLNAAEQRLTERLAELRELESTVSELLGQLDESQEQRLAGLVDVYQRMRAKDAATVFDGLEDETLLQVASRMRQQNLAEIMGKMNPVRARALTQMLADRARPPTDGQALLDRARGAPATGAN